MSESNPIQEDIPEGKEDAVNGDPFQTEQRELLGGGVDEDIDQEQPGEGTVRENIEADLGDRLEHGGQDRL